MNKKILMGSFLLVPTLLLVGCNEKDMTIEKEKDKVINDTTKKIDVLTQSQLVKSKNQQENRTILIENISNTILTSNAQFLSVDKLSEIKDVPILTSKFDKELQIVYIDNEIEKLNNITANYLTEKELKLIDMLLKVKTKEKELYEILYNSWDASEKKYIFTEENKNKYEKERKEILTFLIEYEDDILNSTYYLIHPEIDSKEIEKHLEYQSYIYNLNKNNKIEFEKTLNGKISNIIYHLLSLENDDISKQKAIKEDIAIIEKLQKEEQYNDLYTKNQYVKMYIDNLLNMNTDEMYKNLEKNDYTSIYKEIQSNYSKMYYNYTDNESYLYLNLIEFYLGLLKVEDEPIKPIVQTNNNLDENKVIENNSEEKQSNIENQSNE